VNTNYFDLARICRRYNTLPAILSDELTLTYADLDQAIPEVAATLSGLGIEKSERIAILRDADADYIILLFALWRIGAVAVPINPAFPAGQIGRLLAQINCRAVICNAESRALAEDTGIWIIENTNWRTAADLDDSNILFPLDNDATIIFTSGSSGQAKAVLHSLGNHYYNALGANKNMPLVPGDRWLLSLPLYHVGGLAIPFRVFFAGAALVILKNQSRLAETIDRFRVTHVSLVGTQLYRLLKSPGLPKFRRNLKAVLLGGSRISNSLLEQAHEYGFPIHTSYGCTEMASQVATTAPGDLSATLKTSGRVLDHREIKIASDGEFLVRGKTLFRGYVEGNTIRSATNREGWFATGDLGKLDKNNNLIVLGRKDNMFISGGENIFPEEIEQVLNKLDNVIESIVVGVTDQEFGMRPVAFLQTIDDTLPDPANINEQLSGELPRFKIPRHIFLWPANKEKGLKADRQQFARLAAELTTHD